jgi:hypothetical protein
MKLPWICEEHPDAQIKHSYDETHTVLNGYPAGMGWTSKHKYECSICGKELAPPEQDRGKEGE